jgi:hypothetical protein
MVRLYTLTSDHINATSPSVANGNLQANTIPTPQFTPPSDMAVVVKQTIPFAKEQLDAENSTRWNTLYPLIRPSIKAVKTTTGQTVLVDQTLANDRYVRVVVVGKAGNFSSKLLSDKHITAVSVISDGGSVPSSKELAKAIDAAGHQQQAGIVILRSGKQKKLTRVEDELVELELENDVQVDHLIHLLGAATETTRYVSDLGKPGRH